MNKMLARTALVATLTVSAMSLSACGSDNNENCAHAAASNTTVTATAAMFPSKAGIGHITSHSAPSRGGFRWFWMGHSNQEKCETPASSTKS